MEAPPVLSCSRPLRVLHVHSLESAEATPGISGDITSGLVVEEIVHQTEYVSEEIDSRAHVVMETKSGWSDVMSQTNWTTAMYFAMLSLGSTFVCAASDISASWMVPTVAFVSMVMFFVLKL